MSAKPKLARILDAVASRLAAIDGTGNYSTCVGRLIQRTRMQPSDADLPCCLVYLDAREVGTADSTKQRAITTATLVVEGYIARTGLDDEGQGINVLADIQRATELDDQTLGGLLAASNGGLHWQRDEILYPDSGNNVVGGRVEYSIPHLRKPGDPETA